MIHLKLSFFKFVVLMRAINTKEILRFFRRSDISLRLKRY